MFSETVIKEALDHASEEAPRESCGLVVLEEGHQKYLRCTNASAVHGEFYITPDEYAEVEDHHEIVGVAHSHYACSPEPSMSDLAGCEMSGVPWLIVSHPIGTYKVIQPSGYVAPLKGRMFLHAVFDCYSIIRDYYKVTLGISLKDYPRQQAWWEKGDNLYEDNFRDAGFLPVQDGSLREHDILLMKCRSPVINHGAIYLGGNRILQHLSNRFSSEDVYGGYWQKITVKVVRHKDLV